MHVVVRPKRQAKPQTLRSKAFFRYMPTLNLCDCQLLSIQSKLVHILLGYDVVSVLLNPCTDKVDFALVQELQAKGGSGLLWEVDDDEVGS